MRAFFSLVVAGKFFRSHIYLRLTHIEVMRNMQINRAQHPPSSELESTMDNSTKRTPSPWTTRGWRVTGPTAAADYVATEAVKEAIPEVFVRTVGQAEEVGKAAVCTVYGMSAEEAESNAALIVCACNSHDALVKAAQAARDIFDRQKWIDTSTDPEALALRQLRDALAAAGAA